MRSGDSKRPHIAPRNPPETAASEWHSGCVAWGEIRSESLTMWKRIILRAWLTAPVLGLAAACLAGPAAAQVRIKDIADVDGIRGNQLVGYGLVVGLNGTGDKLDNAAFT